MAEYVRSPGAAIRIALTLQCRFRFLEGTRKIGNVVEGFASDRLGDKACVAGCPTDDDDSRVVIGHGQTPVVLGLAKLAYVGPFQDGAPRHVARTRKCPALKCGAFARIEQDRRAVEGKHVTETVSLDHGYAAKSTPDGNPQLVAADVRVSRRLELGRQSPALRTKRTIAVQHQGAGEMP